MYSILLVEDEKSIIEGLYSIIKSNDFGFERIDRAYDGLQALEMYHQEPYDIILSDIRMPGMDGLEMLRTLREEKSKAQVIFVTAYGEFDYVLSALRLGAANFMLKPINPKELTESIKTALSAMSTQEEVHGNDEDLETLRSYFFKRWLSGDMDNLESTIRAPMVGVNLFLPEYNVVVFRTLSQACTELEQEIEARLREKWSLWVYKEKYEAVMILGGHALDAENIGQVLSCFLDKRTPHNTWFLVVGSVVPQYQEISESYKMCIRTMARPNFYMLGALCKATKENAIPVHSIKQESVISGSALLNAPTDEEIFHLMKRAGNDRETLFSLVTDVLAALGEECFQTAEERDKILINLLEAWTLSGDDYLHAAYRAVTSARELLHTARCNISPIISRTLELISSQYSSPLSLKSIAVSLNVHPAYLGYLFKRETGRFFSDYLNDVRINAAERLLLQTSQSITAIALMVGYSDSHYFSQTFKKHIGMTPAKYRLVAENLAREE